MKAISLWEPWATAMMLGLKKIETRSWPTRYRGDLLICASKLKMDDTARAILGEVAFCVPKPMQVRPGHALCVVRLVSCDMMGGGYTGHLGYPECVLGDYTPGRYAWITTDLRPLARPFSVTGRQGLFDVADELVKEVMANV